MAQVRSGQLPPNWRWVTPQRLALKSDVPPPFCRCLIFSDSASRHCVSRSAPIVQYHSVTFANYSVLTQLVASNLRRPTGGHRLRPAVIGGRRPLVSLEPGWRLAGRALRSSGRQQLPSPDAGQVDRTNGEASMAAGRIRQVRRLDQALRRRLGWKASDDT